MSYQAERDARQIKAFAILVKQIEKQLGKLAGEVASLASDQQNLTIVSLEAISVVKKHSAETEWEAFQNNARSYLGHRNAEKIIKEAGNCTE